jgi:hypothetical protein
LFVHPDSSYSTGFDGWILPEDLGHYFSDLIVEWEDGGENPRVERVLEFCVSEPSDFLSSDGDGFLCCISDLDYWIGLNEGGEYVLADCSPFVSNGISVSSLRLMATEETDSNVLVKRLEDGDCLIVNAAWLKDGAKWTHELAQTASEELSLGGTIVGAVTVHGFTVIGADVTT